MHGSVTVYIVCECTACVCVCVCTHLCICNGKTSVAVIIKNPFYSFKQNMCQNPQRPTVPHYVCPRINLNGKCDIDFV